MPLVQMPWTRYSDEYYMLLCNIIFLFALYQSNLSPSILSHYSPTTPHSLLIPLLPSSFPPHSPHLPHSLLVPLSGCQVHQGRLPCRGLLRDLTPRLQDGCRCEQEEGDSRCRWLARRCVFVSTFLRYFIFLVLIFFVSLVPLLFSSFFHILSLLVSHHCHHPLL